MTQSYRWLTARTKPSREVWAAENVARQGYEAYFPKIAVCKNSQFKAEPLFKSYIFVRTTGAWHFLLSTFGIASVISFGDSPATLPDIEIQKLKAKEVNGCVVLPPKPDTAQFKHGTSVRVKGGMFSGYLGIYEGVDPKYREHTLLDFLGRKTYVLLAPEMLEAA